MGIIKDNIIRVRRIYYAEQYRNVMSDALPFLLNIDKVAYARELGTGGRIKLLANSVEYPRETMERIKVLVEEFFSILDPDLRIYISQSNDGDDGVAMYYSILKQNTEYDLCIELESYNEQKKSILPDPDPDLMGKEQRKIYMKTHKSFEGQKEKGEVYP